MTLSRLCNDWQYLNFPLSSPCCLCFHVERSHLTSHFPSAETQLYSPSNISLEKEKVIVGGLNIACCSPSHPHVTSLMFTPHELVNVHSSEAASFQRSTINKVRAYHSVFIPSIDIHQKIWLLKSIKSFFTQG